MGDALPREPRLRGRRIGHVDRTVAYCAAPRGRIAAPVRAGALRASSTGGPPLKAREVRTDGTAGEAPEGRPVAVREAQQVTEHARPNVDARGAKRVCRSALRRGSDSQRRKNGPDGIGGWRTRASPVWST